MLRANLIPRAPAGAIERIAIWLAARSRSGNIGGKSCSASVGSVASGSAWGPNRGSGGALPPGVPSVLVTRYLARGSGTCQSQ